MKQRDSQRSAVYAWEKQIERLFELDFTYTLPATKKMIDRLWIRYGWQQPQPQVTDGRSRRSACYKPIIHKIAIPRSGRRPVVIIHEVGHALLRKYKGAAHDKVFAKLVFEMLCQELKLDRHKLRWLGMYQKPRRVRFATKKQLNDALRLNGHNAL